MPFPAAPTNGEIYIELTTQRTWRYDSAIPAWRLEERDYLQNYTNTDLTTVPPVDGDVLVLDGAATDYEPNGTLFGEFDPLETVGAAPLSTDARESGIVWHDTLNADAYLAGAYTPPGTLTTHDTGSQSAGSYIVNGGSGISQALTITQTGTYNRLTVNTGTTDTFTFTFYLVDGQNADFSNPINVLASQTYSNIPVSPGPQIIPFPNTVLTAGQQVTWVLVSDPANNPVSIRIGNVADANVLSPIIGPGIVHSATMIALGQDWGFSFGYDNPAGLTDWVKVGFVSPSGTSQVWRDAVEPPFDVMPDGTMWNDTRNGRTYMYDLDATSWVQL